MSKVRRATHAGSWYSGNESELGNQLSGWMSKASSNPQPARAVIVPHAGYSYCGSCGGHAFKQIDPSRVKRIFILGPSHNARLSGCALSTVDKYETPFYDLELDMDVYDQLERTGQFERMSLSVDEEEHSIEMQLPYIAKVMKSHQGNFTIIPVLVGSLSVERERSYGELFSSYLAHPDNLFVISSDFCHWGSRFRYTFYDKSWGDIWQSIEKLDRMGMDIIESMDPVAFTGYLKQYHNTICGRHAIAVLINAISSLCHTGNGHRPSLRFLNYAQSSQCRSMRDSSVSYAAAALNI